MDVLLTHKYTYKAQIDKRLCGLVVKTSIWQQMGLLKMCIQSDWKAGF